MNITITINCDNAAFGDNLDRDVEVARILTGLASRILNFGLDSVTKVMDSNGNSVGMVEVKP